MKRSWLWWGPLPEIQFALVPAADHVTCAWLIRQLPLSHFVLFCFAWLFDVLSRTRESSVCISFCSEGWERWWWWWWWREGVRSLPHVWHLYRCLVEKGGLCEMVPTSWQKNWFLHSTRIKNFPSGLLWPHQGALMQGSGHSDWSPISNSPW